MFPVKDSCSIVGTEILALHAVEARWPQRPGCAAARRRAACALAHQIVAREPDGARAGGSRGSPAGAHAQAAPRTPAVCRRAAARSVVHVKGDERNWHVHG